MAGLGVKGLSTAPDKRVKGADIPLAKRRDIINGLDEDKRSDAVCSVGMRGGTIFGSDKGLKVASRLMPRPGASTALDKKARPNADYSPDGRRDPSPKPEKGSRGAWGPGSRGDVSVAVSGNRKRGAGRPGAYRRC